jgi:glucose-6-phosphate 1-epimerase
LHNYILAPADEVSVTPLQHLAYFDKNDLAADGHPKQKVESRSAVDVRSATDSVYENAPQDYKVEWLDGGIKIRSVNLKDVVVWNPQEGGIKMADMEEDGWYFQLSFGWCYPLTANTRLQEEVRLH